MVWVKAVECLHKLLVISFFEVDLLFCLFPHLFFMSSSSPGDGPSAGDYSKLHGAANRVYCIPEFKTHTDLAVVG
jgi:hypothetical protein